MIRKGGVVLSHASEAAGGLVVPHDDPANHAQAIEAAQPGCIAIPVWDDGHGYLSANGLTPKQIIEQIARQDMDTPNTINDHIEHAQELVDGLSASFEAFKKQQNTSEESN